MGQKDVGQGIVAKRSLGVITQPHADYKMAAIFVLCCPVAARPASVCVYAVKMHWQMRLAGKKSRKKPIQGQETKNQASLIEDSITLVSS